MSLAQSLRTFVPLVIGLVVGGVGASMFMDSMPGANGSPEERVAQLETELKQAQNRLTELQATTGQNRFGTDTKRNLSDGARGLADKMRAGHRISPDDIFRASKPLMRDLAPLFDRMRIRDQKRRIDSIAGELARKYNLDGPQQIAMKQWFDKKAEEEAKRWTEMLGREDTGLEELTRASRDIRPDDGLDKFMEGVLSGEKLAAFKSERLAERVERLQSNADMKVQRLDSIVKLSDAQRDQVFGVMVRNSRDYDPSMVLEGAGGQIPVTAAANPREAMLAVLTPDQRATYDDEQRRRRDEAEKDLNSMGMTLPANWEILEDDNIR